MNRKAMDLSQRSFNLVCAGVFGLLVVGHLGALALGWQQSVQGTADFILGFPGWKYAIGASVMQGYVAYQAIRLVREGRGGDAGS